MNALIVIPARYGSSRLPGKPLKQIYGKTLLQRVGGLASSAAKRIAGSRVLVATDDDRIAQHCTNLGLDWVMTPKQCQSGTDRVYAAVEQCEVNSDVIINLQGDAVFTPVNFIVALVEEMLANHQVGIATPVVPLTWVELDQLRQAKQTSPFSGTTAIVNKLGNVLWFSKNIIPAIRNEDKLKEQSKFSPVNIHVGLYGYRRDLLKKYVHLEQTPYEILEGLEQLRLLEHGFPIHAIKLSCGEQPRPFGIDCMEDVRRAEAILDKLQEGQLNGG